MITEKIISIHKFEPFVLGVCRCGCGERINRIRTAGRLRRYKNNHHSRGKNNYFWTGGKVLDKNGYIQVKSPNHPFKNARGYVQEHRLVMEEYLGRLLKKNECIHHIDFNKQNNNIENLMLFSSHSEHITFERTLDMSGRLCVLCKSTKTKLTKNGNGNWYRYENGFICISCYMKIRYHKNKL